MLRVLAILAALPALVLGGFGLAATLAPDHAAVGSVADILVQMARGAGLSKPEAWVRPLASLLPAAGLLGVGLLLLGAGLWPRREAAPLTFDGDDEGPMLDKRTLRKTEKQAAALAKRGEWVEAAELCSSTGILDRAAEYFEEAEEFVRAAEIRHDQNRLAESAQLYIRAGQHETAGTIFASQNDFARAADCYSKADRMSVAAEMYEKAENFPRAGECYSGCDFHRHAAQAFVRAQDWPRAAEALEAVIVEEGSRLGGGADPTKQKELRKLVLRSGRLYQQAGDLASALRVLERGECYAAAAQVAVQVEDFIKAADLFQRAGDAPNAAEALKRIGEEQAAAQIMGEYYREKGEDDEAARLLVQAGDLQSAGDIYRKLEDYKLAGECYERLTDCAQAAEMFRLAGDWDRAAANFERIERLEEAAECAAQQGDAYREAGYLARAGCLLRAAEVFKREGFNDDAIKALQQVKAEDADHAEASALLGEVFRSKGQYNLAVAKLRQAIGDAQIDVDNVAMFYSLASVHEAAGEMREAADLFEKILAADYHYKDVEQRLEATRALASREALTSPDTLTPSGRPGRYRILGELGRGGMGIVYKAQDTVLDRPVAFKVLPDALKDNPQALKNFLREAKSAAKLNHPNIVTVYDAGEQDGRYYIAMEYVDGTTIKEIIRRRGVISPTGVLHVLVQMCEALHYAHSQKVVHRDIKTANTMWTKDKKAKIMDFGLAKVVEEVRNHTTLVSGTPYYMSPEQTLGKNVDHRTDIYSLGVSLFEMSTGGLPFREGNVPYHHVHTAPPDPREQNPKLPAALAGVVLRCLQKDPAARYQTAGEIVVHARTLMARAGADKAS